MVISDINLVLIGPTRACNLHCAYCLADAPPAGANSAATILPVEKAQALVDHVLEHSRFAKITVIFEEGEPTLVPVGWYNALCQHASREAAKRHKSLAWRMQSNGQTINHEWANLFKRWSIGIGVSIDGPPDIAARQRAGTENAVRSIRLLHAEGIRAGVIVVGTPRNLPHIARIHQYLGELGVCSFHILPTMPLGRAGSAWAVPAAMLAAAYTELIDGFIDHPELPREDRLFRYVMRFVNNDEAHLAEVECGAGTKPCGTEIVFLDSRGDIYPCTRATGQSRRIGEVSGGEVSWSPPKSMLARRALGDAFSMGCLTCSARAICSFSCPAVYAASPQARETECEFHQLLMEHFTAGPDRITKLHSLWAAKEKCNGDHQDA